MQSMIMWGILLAVLSTRQYLVRLVLRKKE